jgi:hypothetical protein
MKTTLTIGLLALCAMAPAQEVKERKQVQVFTKSIDGPPGPMATAPFHFMASEFDWREEQVKGMPYSAEAVSESNQTLADGNRISRKTSTQLYRDGEGRTRREETINAIGPWAAGAPHKLIFVNDPVAKVNWVIDPQLKEARKMTRTVTVEGTGLAAGVGADTIALPPHSSVETGRLRVESEDVTIGVAGTMTGGTPGRRVQIQHAPGTAAISATGPTVMFMSHKAENANTEPLGKRMIEGVEAEGTRTTFTTPAGEIGNERPIVSESERWYSPELKVTVMTRHSDPRTGENTYKLTNLRRGEPGAALFQPPPDYKVIEAGSQVIHMRRHVEK